MHPAERLSGEIPGSSVNWASIAAAFPKALCLHIARALARAAEIIQLERLSDVVRR